MVLRHYLRCKICKQLLILKVQKSDTILYSEFSIYCGKCFTEFIISSNDNNIYVKDSILLERLELTNNDAKNLEESAFIFEISSEFPVEMGKFKENQSINDETNISILTPFMRSLSTGVKNRNVKVNVFMENADNFLFFKSFLNLE